MHVRPSTRRTRQARRGAAAVEVAVLLPLLSFLVVAAVDYGRVFYHALTLANCARNGAMYGAHDPAFAVDAAAIKKAALVDASNLSPIPTVTSATGTGGDGHPFVEVTCTWKFQTVATFPGIPRTVQLARTVRMRVAPNQPADPDDDEVEDD